MRVVRSYNRRDGKRENEKITKILNSKYSIAKLGNTGESRKKGSHNADYANQNSEKQGGYFTFCGKIRKEFLVIPDISHTLKPLIYKAFTA